MYLFLISLFKDLILKCFTAKALQKIIFILLRGLVRKTKNTIDDEILEILEENFNKI
ncbi:MAG: hypothetical protein ACRDDH_09320 [Cetobacterium sp.]|uniref:hypothetical protein n=1 Tax=Cetobacterium sp. TaxID=2071632 RepID=UPI003EE44FC2